MVGYLKSTPDYCVLLEIPVGVKGDGIQLTNIGCLKVSVTVTGAQIRRTGDLQAAGYTCSMAHSFCQLKVSARSEPIQLRGRTSLHG